KPQGFGGSRKLTSCRHDLLIRPKPALTGRNSISRPISAAFSFSLCRRPEGLQTCSRHRRAVTGDLGGRRLSSARRNAPAACPRNPCRIRATPTECSTSRAYRSAGRGHYSPTSLAPSLCHSPARRCGCERTAVYLGLTHPNPPAAADYTVVTELER